MAASLSRILSLGLSRRVVTPSLLKRNGLCTSASVFRTQQEASDYVKKELDSKWVSHGFDFADEKLDKEAFKWAYFSFAGTLVFLTFILFYMPDYRNRDWYYREAFLVLREREALGIEPIDKNFVDPAKLVLPTDEELGDTTIIV